MDNKYWFGEITRLHNNTTWPVALVTWIMRQTDLLSNMKENSKDQPWCLEDELLQWNPFRTLDEVSPGVWEMSIFDETTAWVVVENGKVVSALFYSFANGELFNVYGKGRAFASAKKESLSNPRLLDQEFILTLVQGR